MTGGQRSDNLESFSFLFRSQKVVSEPKLVAVANLSRPSIGKVSLASAVEYLIAKLELVFLQSVDVVLELGQLRVESFLLGSQGVLRERNS